MALITINEIKESGLLDKNVLDSYINSSIKTAEDIGLVPLLGSVLYNIILEDQNKYPELLNDYIKPYLLYKVISDVTIPLQYKYRNAGVVYANDVNYGTISINEIQHIAQYWENKAKYYETRLVDYLTYSDIPEYLQTTKPGVDAKRTTYNAGIVLTPSKVQQKVVNKISLEDKTIDITANGEYNLKADDKYDGLGNVDITVNIPLQDKDITLETTDLIVPDEGFTAMKSVNVTIPPLQEKTVYNPVTSTITADDGYIGLSKVDIQIDIQQPINWIKALYAHDEEAVRQYSIDNNVDMSNLIALRYYGTVDLNLGQDFKDVIIPYGNPELTIIDGTSHFNIGKNRISPNNATYSLFTWVGKNFNFIPSSYTFLVLPNFEEGYSNITSTMTYLYIGHVYANHKICAKQVRFIMGGSYTKYNIDLSNYDWQKGYDLYSENGQNVIWCNVNEWSTMNYMYNDCLGDWYYEGVDGNGFRDRLIPTNIITTMRYIKFNEDENGKYSGTFKSNSVYNFSYITNLGDNNNFWSDLLEKLPDGLENVVFNVNNSILSRITSGNLLTEYIDKGITFTT